MTATHDSHSTPPGVAVRRRQTLPVETRPLIAPWPPAPCHCAVWCSKTSAEVPAGRGGSGGRVRVGFLECRARLAFADADEEGLVALEESNDLC